MASILTDIIALLFPRHCKVCGAKLSMSEEFICTPCLMRLPVTRFDPLSFNPVMQRFVGCPAVQHATAHFFYMPGNAYSQLITKAKYQHQPEIGRYMGHMAASCLSGTGFFDGITLVHPIPLSRFRKWERGYNQSDWIAKGVADATHLTVCTNAIVRHHHNETQTHMSHEKRWQNVQNIFSVRHPERLAGQHVLLVDDVITTGATLFSCADTLSRAVPDIRITVLALSCARGD